MTEPIENGEDAGDVRVKLNETIAKANTAVQPGDIGTAAAADADAFATAAQGTLAETALQPGDIVAFTEQDPGLVPAPGAGAAERYLRPDGSWVTFPSGGSVAWTDVTSKPETFPPEAHSHTVSDITDFPSLGTAAAADADAFATAAQGQIADTAVQPGDLAVVATTGAYTDLTGLPSLGTAAAANVGDFATAAQGTLAETALQEDDLVTAADKPTPVSADKVLVFDSEDDDAPKTVEFGAFATAAQGSLADTALQPGDEAPKIEVVSAETPTLDADWNGAAVVLTHATPTLTIPDTAFPAGYQVSVVSAVDFVIEAAAGVDLNGEDGESFDCSAAPGAVSLIRIGVDDWLIIGDCEVSE